MYALRTLAVAAMAQYGHGRHEGQERAAVAFPGTTITKTWNLFKHLCANNAREAVEFKAAKTSLINVEESIAVLDT